MQQAPFEDVVRNLRNPDPKVRFNAVRMLRESRHPEAAIPVAAVVTDPIDEIQLEAIAAEMSFFLVHEVPTRKYVALVVEVRTKEQAAEIFELGALATWPAPAPAEVLDALLKAVDDENPRVRMEAIYTVGVVGRPPLPPVAVASLLRALDHYDPAVRVAAVRVAGRLQVAPAGDALIRLVNDSHTPVRFAAMRALGEVHEERAIQALSEQFNYYGKGEGAWSALDGLARIGHASSADLFRSRLADRDPLLRTAAAEGLGRIGNPNDASAVRAAFAREGSETSRVAMAFAMVRLKDPQYVARLVDALGSSRTSLQAQSYVLELGPAVLPDLIPRLQDPSSAVRSGVVELVGALGTSEQMAVLEPLTKDRDRSVAEAASVALERIKLRK